MNNLQLTSIFVIIDDFCKSFLPSFEKRLIESKNVKTRKRTDCLSILEIITLLIWFNNSGMNHFKHFYYSFYQVLIIYFPKLPKYNAFLEAQKKAFIPMLCFMQYLVSLSDKTDVYYIDSTYVKVCGNKRIDNNKTFKDFAKIGKSTMGWFFGFKLHIITNHLGQIVSLRITTGNVHDVKEVDILSKDLKGLLFGDKGYISEALKERLIKQGLELITNFREKMKKKKTLSETNKYLLKKRSIIETIFGKLKDFQHLVHTKYRSTTNFFMNIFSSVLSYQLNPKKPKVNLNRLGVA